MVVVNVGKSCIRMVPGLPGVKVTLTGSMKLVDGDPAVIDKVVA
jgi:hypothetical protein